jgi:hypothetical protein
MGSRLEPHLAKVQRSIDGFRQRVPENNCLMDVGLTVDRQTANPGRKCYVGGDC